VFLSVLWHFAPARVAVIRRLRWALVPAGLLLTAPCYLLSNEHPFVLTLGLTLNYLGYGMLLAAVLTLPRVLPRPLEPALASVGFYSYSIYLWHLPFLAVVRSAFGDRAVGVAVFYAGSIVAGVVMARLVEIPALRLRERWVPAPAASSA
jgi:peptidoglycan/LPS O-acetylase OafA/YrhL